MPVKVSVTYHAPKDDSKVCEIYGHTFFDGHALEIEDNEENQHAIAKLSRNKVFEVARSAATKVVQKVQDRRQARQAEPEPEPEPDPEPVPEPEPIEEDEPEIEKPKRTAPSRRPAKRNAPWLPRAKK
jgi:hypothetical protein